MALPIDLPWTTRDALKAFKGSFAPVASTPRLRLLVAALLLLSLVQLVFLGGLIAGTVWVTWLVVDYMYGFRPASGVVAAIFMGLFAGSFIIALLRPFVIFLRRRKPDGVPLARSAEPDMFAFVTTIATLVGAPIPTDIYIVGGVTAWARAGNRLRGRGAALGIGLPLVGGLTCRQFAGIVAHELGHFSQHTGGFAARLAGRLEITKPLIIKEVAELKRTSHRLTSILYTVVQLVLFLLSLIERPLARALSRAHELDADRYAMRLAGSDALVRTFNRLVELSMAEAKVHADIVDRGRQPKRLLRDVLKADSELTAKEREEAARHVSDGTTRWNDTHPSFADRIEAAQSEKAPGVYRCDGPASLFLRDMDSLDERLTAPIGELAASLRQYRRAPVNTL